MKKDKAALKPAKKTSPKSNPKTAEKRKSFLEDLFSFGWLKKAMVGKTQDEPLDLLDQWILKKRTFSLFL